MAAANLTITALDLVCPPRTDTLHLIRDLVTTVSREVGFGDDEISQIEISVDEACANVIRHAYRVCEPAVGSAETVGLTVQIRPSQERLTIAVIDHGRRISCEAFHGVASLEEYIRQPAGHHGLGSFIISRFMDEVKCDSSADAGTVFSMVKYLHRSANLPLASAE